VNLLLDAHTLLWALHDPGKLRAEAAAAIRDSSHAVFYSAASVWELELKAAVGKLELPDGWLSAAEGSGFLELR
jgi:PIN domain nuclease of toxin-antitoxin system